MYDFPDQKNYICLNKILNINIYKKRKQDDKTKKGSCVT